MKPRMFSFVCPYCQHSFAMKRDTVALAGITDQVEERLKDRTYFTHQCSRCHCLFELEYPFFFRHGLKHFALWMHADMDPSFLDEQDLGIHCNNAKQFTEAYRILDQGLSIGYILRKQKLMERTTGKNCIFDRIDLENRCLWFKVEQDWKAMRIDEAEWEQKEYLRKRKEEK